MSVANLTCKKTAVGFESFPSLYVCPEPVLVKHNIFISKAGKKPVFAYAVEVKAAAGVGAAVDEQRFRGVVDL